MFIQQLQFNIAAGETKRFEFQGAYVEVIDSQAAINITVYDPVSSAQGNATGVLSGFFASVPYKGVEVYSATAQSITLLLTDGSGGSRRQPGNVKVIDDSASRTMLDQAYSGSFTAGASGAQGSMVTVGATGGNGKRLAIRSMLASSTIAGRIMCYIGSTGGTMAPAVQLRSKWAQAASQSLSGQARAQAFNQAAAQPSGAEISGLASWFAPYLPANTPTQCAQGGTPIVLETGRILVLSAEALNRDLSVWFDVEEF